VVSFIRHGKPLPDMDSEAGPGQAMCTAEIDTGDKLWLCTREAAHPGDHQAGGLSGQMLLSWLRPQAEITFTTVPQEQ
jgi:hypothetical protein